MTQDLNRYFQVEAEDLLSRITAALEGLRAEPVTAETLRELRRWTHTLKGAAQVVRREGIARSAHRLETVLDQLAESGGGPALDVAIALAGEMSSEILHPAQSPPVTSTATPTPGVPEPQETATLRVDLHELDGLLQAVNESAIVASGLRRLFGPLERARDLAAMLTHNGPGTAMNHNLQQTEILAEEMRAVIAEALRGLDVAAEHVQRELDGLRARTENLRLVRADTIIPMLEQSVRAAAAAAGKSVEFQASGADIELDAHLLIAARDALIQLARNAVAHGIEAPAERTAAGKPSAGQVRVEFRRAGPRNVMAVQDDGRGIDFEALRAQAVRRGWLTASQAKKASAQELTQFLLRPGVTTARSASVLAGRGVGLDLVSSAVARMKGELRITAEPGKGTTISISVPASMNSATMLMVQAGNQICGIPLDCVRRTAATSSLQRLSDRLVISGTPLPVVSLATLFGPDSSRAPVVVEISAEPHPFLLAVDSLLGIRTTVIYTLPEYMGAEPWVLGASVESEGHLRLILDPAMLAGRIEELAHPRLADRSEPSVSLPILVIDDSLTTRMLEQSIFEMEGYTVDLAGSAEEGLAMARQKRYGLFLVDVEMPGMDGIAFVERVQQEPPLRETPAVLVTSRGSKEDRARGLRAGAQEYMVKSEFDQRLLLNRVRELMRAR